MSEIRKTMTFAGAAILLVILALATTPRRSAPDAFFDIGESFFPEFTDPNTAVSLEVVNFDSETGEAIPFKVVFENDRWTIPSHHNYPADGKDRLSKTAAGLIGLEKADFRTDNVADHALCGVIDPLDETSTALEGRGKRVTIKGTNEKILADLILGKKVEEREGYRFVRVPGQKRVYVAKADIDISTKFSDWIDAELLKIAKDKVETVLVKDYRVNERTGAVNYRDEFTLDVSDTDNWRVTGMSQKQEVDEKTGGEVLKALDELSIVGVRPKPHGLSESLSKTDDAIEISNADLRSLQSKGFYFSRDGSLLSNEGEIQVSTNEGVVYTLRFGEVAYGSGREVSSGSGDDAAGDENGENRFLFISTHFDDQKFPEPKKPVDTGFLNKPDSLLTNTDRQNKAVYDTHEAWREKVENGRRISEDLNKRFARWYYVISADNFDKLHVSRKDLLKAKESA